VEAYGSFQLHTNHKATQYLMQYIHSSSSWLSFTGEWVAQSYTIQRRTVDCIGHIWRRNCLL